MPRPAGEYVGPDVVSMDRAVRMLERSHDDGAIRDALGRQKELVRDAVTGEVQPAYHYRLECGRIEVVWTTPLPASRTVLYCPEDKCQRERRIVEQLSEGMT